MTKKEVKPKKVNDKIVNSLTNAIVDGKIKFSSGSKVYASRRRDGKTVVVLCEIRSIKEDGLVEAWDETVNQWFMFDINTPPEILKILSEHLPSSENS